MKSPQLPYDEINEFIRASSPEAVIYIGCDSMRTQKGKRAVYSTVVCVRKASGAGKDVMYHGCRVFGGSVTIINRDKVIRSGKLKGIKARMMQEVAFALEAFDHVHEAIGERTFEIHLDINSRPECESHVALADAKG